MKTVRVPVSYFNQVRNALLVMNQFEEAATSKERSKLHDPHFGPELQYVIDRAFARPPFAKERSLAGIGWIDQCLSPNTLRQYSVSKIMPDDLELIPFLIEGNFDLFGGVEDNFLGAVLLREFWKVHRETGPFALPLIPLHVRSNDYVQLDQDPSLEIDLKSKSCLLGEWLNFHKTSPVPFVMEVTALIGRTERGLQSKMRIRVLKPSE